MNEPEIVTNGSAILIGDGASPEVFTEINGVFQIQPPQPKRPTIPVSYLKDGAVRKKQGQRDNGDVTMQYRFLPDDMSQGLLRAADASGALTNYRLTVADEVGTPGAGRTIQFAAYVVISEEPLPIDGVVNHMGTLTISGVITPVQ